MAPVINSGARGTLAAAVGTGDFTTAVWARANTLGGTTPTLFDIYGDQHALYVSGGNSVGIRSAASGLGSAPAGSMVVDEWALWTYTRISGVGRLYKNAKLLYQVGDTGNMTSAVVGVGWNSYYATQPFQGAVVPFFYNRGLTQTDVTNLYNRGTPDEYDYANYVASIGLYQPNGVELLTTATRQMDGGHSWNIASGTISGGVYSTAGSGQSWAYNSFTTPGKRYRCTFTVLNWTSGLVGIACGNQSFVYAANGTYTVEFIADSSTFYIGSPNAAGVGSVDDVSLIPIGVMLAPDQHAPGNGLVWNDMSGGGCHLCLDATNTPRWLVPSARPNRIRGTTSTNGTVNLLGTTVFARNSQFLKIRARARTGTPTVSVADAGTSQNIVANVALASTWKDLTIVLAGGIYTAGNMNIAITSNSTDLIDWDFSVEPLSP